MANLSDLKTFYETHADRVYRLCFGMTGDPLEAEECVQQTFIDAYKGIAGFRGESKLDTWIYRIAVNACKRHLKKRAKERARYTPLDADIVQIPDGGRSPEAELIEREGAQAVWDALNRLDENQRAVVILRDMEGRDYRDISAMLGWSMGTVASRLARARRRLASILSEKLGRKPGRPDSKG